MTYISKADTSNGVMVALFPSPATAAMLSQPGGELAQDLHVTLAFLGDATDLQNPVGLTTAVQRFASDLGPIAGEISGVGQFTAGPEPVVYASVDVPGLELFRARLIDVLQQAGFEPSMEHGFVPHITLGYGYDVREPYLQNLPLAFDTITVAIGGERSTFALTGTVPMVKAEDLSTSAWNGSPAHFTDEQWTKACLLDRGATFHTPKTRYALPVREPDGTLNRRALAAAQAALNGGRGGVKAPAAAISAAKSKLAKLRQDAGLTKADQAAAEWDVPIWKAEGTVPPPGTPLTVYGVVLHPGVTDSQGDLVSADEIEKAAHRWLIESRMHDVQHDARAMPDAFPVESYIAPSDLVFKADDGTERTVLKGSWVVGIAVNDQQCKQDVVDGRLTGLSIGGSAFRSESAAA